jgi:hypothetical protein
MLEVAMGLFGLATLEKSSRKTCQNEPAAVGMVAVKEVALVFATDEIVKIQV